MHKFAIHAIALVCLLSTFATAQETASTTFYIVRHAERTAGDELTEAGVKRAKELATIMKSFRVSAVYSTDTQRTQSTARPTAEAMELSITSYGNLTADWFDQLKERHQGETVLIVGHSNTSGEIVNGLGGQGDFSLREDEYDNLFIVTVTNAETQAIKVKYGEEASDK